MRGYGKEDNLTKINMNQKLIVTDIIEMFKQDIS